ncbi:hypothetical protein H1Q59_02185 [Holosporaceae bacterium 'Namur']|nr:hypothetical protein [Holosporaceae bacterium 'Namur']
MLKLTENQKKLVNEFNKELKSHLGCPFVPSPLPPYYHFHKTLFYNKLKSNLILKGLTQDFYNKNNNTPIDLSNPKEEHDLALKLNLYKAPKDFNRFNDQDIKDYFLLYKDTFKDINPIEKTIRSGMDNLIPDGGRKFIIQGAKDFADQHGMFQGDKIDIALLKKINFADRDPKLYSEIFSSLDYNMLTPDALEYTKLTANTLNFKESDKIKQRIDEQIRAAKEAEEKRSKHHEELKENFAKQGLDIDKILKNSAEQMQELRILMIT